MTKTHTEILLHPEATEGVCEHSKQTWGHHVDREGRIAIRLVLADQWLSAMAGTTEEAENAAYRLQTSAFNAWWYGFGDIHDPETIHARDMTYGWALSEVRSYKRSMVERLAA